MGKERMKITDDYYKVKSNRKKLFKDGMLILPKDRPEIKKQLKEKAEIKETLKELGKIWQEKDKETSFERKQRLKRMGKERLYIASESLRIIDDISNYIERRGGIEVSSGEFQRPLGGYETQIEYSIDNIPVRKVNEITEYLSRFGNRVKWDIYESHWIY
jgi:hypothetical protein